MTAALRTVVLISGGGSNLQAIIDTNHVQRRDASICAVVSSDPNAYGLTRANQASIQTQVVDPRAYPTPHEFNLALERTLAQYDPELVVLAGFMRILTPSLVDRYLGRLLNIHPSLLPAFPGLNTHRRVLESTCDTHGASVHFVTAELDAGPVILQANVPVKRNDTPETLAARVLVEEHRIYPQVVSWFAAGRLAMRDGMATLDGELINDPLGLSVYEH
ncbi:MAG: phosphoribosylglycinamide formyltransferase [Pseudomonadota bacterium]